jgi:hypothetical protein
MVTATSMLVLHRRAHSALSDGLRKFHPADLRRWEKMVQAWESDGSKPNPYIYAAERTLAVLSALVLV